MYLYVYDGGVYSTWNNVAIVCYPAMPPAHLTLQPTPPPTYNHDKLLPYGETCMVTLGIVP